MAEEKLTPLQSELLNRADTIFGAIRDAAMAAKDIAVEQLPDIAQQFIVYSRVSHTLFFIIGILLLLFSVYLFLTVNARASSDAQLFSCVGGIISFLLGFMIVIDNMKPLMMVWFAPKIYLITELAKLIKG